MGRMQAVSEFCGFCRETIFSLVYKNTFDHQNRVSVIGAEHGDPRMKYFNSNDKLRGTPVGKLGNMDYASVLDKWHHTEFLRDL